MEKGSDISGDQRNPGSSNVFIQYDQGSLFVDMFSYFRA